MQSGSKRRRLGARGAAAIVFSALAGVIAVASSLDEFASQLTKDAAFTKLGLTGEEPEERLIELMARHPTLLQRPIGVAGNRAVVGRPPEALLELVKRG